MYLLYARRGPFRGSERKAFCCQKERSLFDSSLGFLGLVLDRDILDIPVYKMPPVVDDETAINAKDCIGIDDCTCLHKAMFCENAIAFSGGKINLLDMVNGRV